MHKPFIIIISLCLAFFLSKAQNDIKKYIRQNTIQVSTIEPDSTDYRDLEEIGNAIGESRIVMLGEQDHGDAPAFLAKTRLIKYLHEKKGFNVVAFESDFFGLNYGWDGLSKSKNEINSFLKNNIFPVWTVCDGCQNLFYQTIPNGTSGRLTKEKRYNILKPTKNSIEKWFDESLNYGFVDFRKFNELNPNNSVKFKMKANLIGTNIKNHQAQWTHIYDGLFYIKKMYPCTFVR